MSIFSRKKSILILYTGGTIGMIASGKRHTLVPFNFKKIETHIPELKELHCKITFKAFEQAIDSSNVDVAFWQRLADELEKDISKYDGIVLLHGTDTMAYSASMLSFMLENLRTPIIMTGSQVPLGAIRNDARRNLITAVEIAASTTVVPEVAIYFNNQLFRGNRAEKYSSSKFDAFHSLNYPALAEAGVTIDFHEAVIRKPGKGRLKVHKKINNNVAIVKLFPGLSPKQLNQMLTTEGLRAAVIETFGSGNASTDRAFIGVLKTAIDNGIIIVNTSQCSGGSVDQGKYETSLYLKQIGVISGRDMTTEAAITKLMFLFGNYRDTDTIRKMLQQNLRGEMAEAKE